MAASAQPPLSKTEYVARRLREDLADGVISPGDSLSQADIAVRYGVSATPVREAMRTLEAEGLIVYLTHKGATVADLPTIDIHDLYLFRREVEGLTARLAVERATDKQIARLRQIHQQIADGIDDLPADELSRLNREFHLAVIGAGSPFIEEYVMRPLWERVIPTTATIWREPEAVQHFVRDHERIVRALENRDARSAEEYLRNHVSVAAGLRERRGGDNDA